MEDHMAFDEKKLKAARERLKKHPGGENLVLIDSPERAKEMQLKARAARDRNAAERKELKAFIDSLGDMEEVAAKMPKAVDVLKIQLAKATLDEDAERITQLAALIAPYETPKLAAQEITQTNIDLKDLSDEEFEQEKKRLEEE